MNEFKEYELPFLKVKPINPAQADQQFDECYKNICSYEFSLTDFDQGKTFIGNYENKVCAFCGKNQTQVSFKKEAHIIPAAFGNRWLLSFEECDLCNSQLGDSYENEISKMFEAQRIISRIPKRKGFPKMKTKGKNSEIEIDSKDGLIISTQVDENIIKILPTSNNSFALVLPGQTYNPISAIKSIAHAVWLLLNQDSRKKHGDLLKWIKGESPVLPILFYEGMIPGPGYDVVGIKIWELYKCVSEMPRLLVKFYFGNSFVFWGMPDFQKEISYPGILPPIQCSPYQPYQPTLKLNKVLKDEKMKTSERTFNMNYNRVIKELDTGNIEIPELFKNTLELENNNEKLLTQLPILVKLIAKNDINTIEVDNTFVSIKKMEKDEEFELFLSGGNLAGTLKLLFRGEKVEGEFDEDLTLLPIDLSQKSHLLFRQLNEGCKLIIEPLNTTLIRSVEVILSPTGVNQEVEDCITNIFKSLEVINSNLQLDIKYPRNVTGEIYNDINFLADGIEHGQVKKNIKELDIEVNKEQLIELVKILDGNIDINGSLNLCTFSIEKVQIEGVKMTMQIIKPVFADGKEKINLIVEKISNDQSVKVKLNCVEIIYSFLDYIK